MNNISEITLLVTSTTKGRKTKNSGTAENTQGKKKCYTVKSMRCFLCLPELEENRQEQNFRFLISAEKNAWAFHFFGDASFDVP